MLAHAQVFLAHLVGGEQADERRVGRGFFDVGAAAGLFAFHQAEHADNFESKFARRFTETRITDLLNLLQTGAELVPVAGTLQICRDPKDDMVIETAVSGRADAVVTGDKDLTDAVEVTDYLAEQGIQVLSIRVFVGVLQLLQPDPPGQPPRGSDPQP